MAEVTEVAIFEVDASSYIKTLADLTKSITDLKEQQKQLSEQTKQGNEEAGKALEKVNATIKVQQQEYRTAQAVLVGYEAAQKKQVDTQNFANNSIAANRALLKQLTAQYIETKNPSQQFTNQLKSLTDTLKKQETAYGDNRRSVGSYAEGMKEALQSSGLLTGALAPLAKAQEAVKIGFKIGQEAVTGFKASLDAAKQTGEQFSAAVQRYDQAQQKAAAATEAVNEAQKAAEKIGFKYAAAQATVTEVEAAQGAVTAAVAVETEALAAAQVAGAEATTIATTAMNVFKTALISTGIGAVVVAVGLLIQYFTKFDPLIDKIEQGFAKLGAGIRVVQQALAGLFSGDLSGFDNLTDKVITAADASGKLKEAQQELEDAFAIQDVQNQKTSQQYSELIVKSKNRTLSEKERLAFLKEAEKIETENFKQRELLANRQLEQAIEAARIEGKLTQQEIKTLQARGTAYAYELLNLGRITQAEVDLIKKAEVDKIAILQESTNRLEKNQNAQDKLAEDAAKNAEKAQQQREKELAAIKAYNDQIAKLEDETLLTQREKLIKSYDDKLDIIKGNTVREVELRKALEREKVEAIIAFDKELQQKELDNRKELEAKRLDIIRQSLNEELQLNQQQLQNELDLIDLSVGLEQDKAQRKLEVQLEYLQKQLDITEQLAEADNVLTQSELANIESIRIALTKLQNQISGEGEEGNKNKNAFAALGLTDEELAKAKDSLQQAQVAFESLASVISASYEVRLNQIDEQSNAEIAAVEASAESEDVKAKKIDEINKRTAREKYEIEKEQFETAKATSIISAVINTALAVVSALATAPTIIAGVVFAALAAATGAAQIAVIASQQPPPPPKFATGVIGLDGAGTETSDSIPAYLSKGESVITAKATRKYHRELAQMELSVGNQPNYQIGSGKFAGGIIDVPTTDAGFTTSGISTNVNELVVLQSIDNGLRNMPTPVVSVVEIDRVTTRRNQSVAVSEL